MMTASSTAPLINFSRRDIVCFGIALAFHALLLLWKGGFLNLEDPNQNLGDMIVEVGFVADAQGLASAPVEVSKPTQTLMARMKNFFTMPAEKPTAENNNQLAMGKVSEPLDSKALDKNEAVSQLNNKDFSIKKAFQGLGAVPTVDLSKGVETSPLSASALPRDDQQKSVAPALKEKTFEVASKDMPFQMVKPNELDSLSNTNTVPVEVGNTTSKSVQVSNSADMVAPSMKSKEMSSDSLSKKAFASSDPSHNPANQLAMGSSANDSENAKTQPLNSEGVRSYSAANSSSENKDWTNTALATPQMESLSRRSFQDQPAGKSSMKSGDRDFVITGALAGREITTKIKPPYDKDWEGRVALKFGVDWSGRVLDGIVVVLSSGSPSFDQRVIAALKNWIFVPLSKDRTNEIQEGVVTFTFRGV